MKYVSLKKIHYKQPDIEEEVYQRRYAGFDIHNTKKDWIPYLMRT